jgi:hypothetical protein
MSHRSAVTFDTVCLILFVWAQRKRQLDRADVSHTCSFNK